MDNVQKETHVVSVLTNQCTEICTVLRDEKDDRLLPHQIRRPRLTKEEKNPQKHQATERKTLQTQGARFSVIIKTVKIRHVNFGILLCVKTTSLRPNAYMEENVSSDMLRLRRKKPCTKSKKDGAKGSVASLKESTQLGCVSRFLSGKVYSTRKRKIKIKTRRQILQVHLAQI